MKTCGIANAAACLIVVSQPCAALTQTEAAETSEDATFVVTANRAPVRIEQVGQSITVLDQKAIEASQALGVTELLARSPGVTFSRNGGAGKTTSVYIRGAENGQTLVLYDGVRLSDPSTPDAGASLSDVMTADIGKIEILRGAQSTLWGSQAIGGVINIVSRTPTAPFEANAQAEGGELASYLAKAGMGGKTGRLSWRLAGSYMATQGVSAFSPGTEADGYENMTLSGRVNVAVTDRVELDLRSHYTHGRNDFDDFNADAPFFGRSRNWLSYAGINFDLFGRLENKVAYTHESIDRRNYDAEPANAAPALTFDALGKSDRFEYQGTLAIRPGWSTVFGIEHVQNSMRTASPSVFDPDPTPIRASDHSAGVYGQLLADVGAGLSLSGGIRLEGHSNFGNSTVGSASAAWTFSGSGTVIRASWTEGFKAPSLYQLYSEYGNTALAPEAAESWDLGVEQRVFDAILLSAVYFHRDSVNLVNFASCTGSTMHPLCSDGRFGYYVNIGKARAEGLELGANIAHGPLSLSANYTYLKATNMTAGDANLGNRLARRPQDSFNADASFTWPFALVTSVALRMVGDSYNDAGNTQRLRGYWLTDFRLSYPVSSTIELYGRIENAFDEQYETIKDNGTEPRTIHGGVRVQF